MSTDTKIGNRPERTPGDTSGRWLRSPVRKVLLAAAVVSLATFWIWAIFFASRESINKIGDEAWAARAESICVGYDARLAAIDARASTDIAVRAELVEESTTLLSAMLDEVVAVAPTDDKGKSIVPDWEADYRILLQDRFNYAKQLAAGENVPFAETPIQGVPITERIEQFTIDNAMKSCAPPRGSVF